MKVRQNGTAATAGAGSWGKQRSSFRTCVWLHILFIAALAQTIIAQDAPNGKIQFLSGLTSWEDCRNALAGRHVMLCFWGTGCKPCIKIFAEHQRFVDSLCSTMNITKVYMPADYRKQDDSLYHALIETYNLSGNHITLEPGTSLRESVFNVFFPKQGNTRVISVPLYVLLDANGNIVHPHLPAPNQHQRLIETLQYAL